MRTMIWKEWRENLKWAVLAMIGLSMAEFYGLYRVDRNDYMNTGVGTLCSSTFYMATNFGCALVGLLLGFLQILPERRRDQWAALLHRPVSRDVIFFGKVVAGVALYLVATGIPLLACVWLVATPGHFVTPYVPGMELPALADLCTGLAYYFAALLVALRPGSWFGARTLAIFAAVHLSFFVNGAGYFYTVVLAAGFMSLALLIGAWSSMSPNGSFRVCSWPAKIALLAVFFYGLCGLGDIAKMITSVGNQDDYTGSYYQITREGQPVRMTTNSDLTTTLTDLQGNVIKDERYRSPGSYDNFLRENGVTNTIGEAHPINAMDYYIHFRDLYFYITKIETNVGTGPVRWFYLPKDRYFLGVSFLNNKPVKKADRSGFKPLDAPLEPFSLEARGMALYDVPVLLADENVLYVVDFVHETQITLSAADQGKIYGATCVEYKNKEGTYTKLLAMAFAHEIQVYDLKGNLIATLPYHQDVDYWGSIMLCISPGQDRYFLKYGLNLWRRVNWDERLSMPGIIEEMDAHGNLLHTYELPSSPRQAKPRSWPTYVAESARSLAFWYGDLAYQKVGSWLGNQRLADANYNSFHKYMEGTREMAIRNTSYSLIFALITLIWARRVQFSWRRAGAWAFFVLLFNVGGLIVFRLATDWPVLVACPSCGKKRSVEEETCPHCHAGWPAPRNEGTEIFDSGSHRSRLAVTS